MYRNYEEYEKALGEMIAKAPAGVRFKKKTREEFAKENYRDKVEWYLMNEWCTETFLDIIYRDVEYVEDDESDEMTPEEEVADEMHNHIFDIIDCGLLRRESVNETARVVYGYLKREGRV